MHIQKVSTPLAALSADTHVILWIRLWGKKMPPMTRFWFQFSIICPIPWHSIVDPRPSLSLTNYALKSSLSITMSQLFTLWHTPVRLSYKLPFCLVRKRNVLTRDKNRPDIFRSLWAFHCKSASLASLEKKILLHALFSDRLPEKMSLSPFGTENSPASAYITSDISRMSNRYMMCKKCTVVLCSYLWC